MITLAMVTLICGSSSRGVTSTAKSPSMATRGEQRREGIRLEGSGNATTDTHGRRLCHGLLTSP